jgi:hypothetical protein
LILINNKFSGAKISSFVEICKLLIKKIAFFFVYSHFRYIFAPVRFAIDAIKKGMEWKSPTVPQL